MKFSTVALGVEDLDRAERFYRGGLGLELSSRPRPDLVYLATGETRIALFPRAALAEYAGMSSREPGGVVLALNLDSIAEVDRRFGQALAHGARTLRAPGAMDWGGHAGTLADPDGHVWELVFNPQPG